MEGWQIKGVKVVPGTIPHVYLRITHGAAEHDVQVDIWPRISFGLSGNIMLANVELDLALRDYMKEKEEDVLQENTQ